MCFRVMFSSLQATAALLPSRRQQQQEAACVYVHVLMQMLMFFFPVGPKRECFSFSFAGLVRCPHARVWPSVWQN